MNNCKQCNLVLESKFSKNIFCSKNCAARFNNLKRKPRSIDSKLKTSTTMLQLLADGMIKPGTPPSRLISEYPYTKLYGTYNCHSCNNMFWRLKDDQKCCSIPCRDNIRSQNKCRKTQILYFNINEDKFVNLQSTWEAKIAVWLDANNIQWHRPAERIKWFDTTLCKNRTYLPDFWLVSHSVYLDVKNPLKQLEDADKILQLKSIIPLYVGDIDYIKSKPWSVGHESNVYVSS